MSQRHFLLSRWTILLGVLGVIFMIVVAWRNPTVTHWVKVVAPALFLPETPEVAKCYDFFEDEDFSGSPDELQKKAEQGNASAQAALGTEYFWGRLSSQGGAVGQDYTKAEFWLRKAAEQGKAKAQSLLARLYADRNRGMAPDWEEADFWVTLAMEQERSQPAKKGLPSCEALPLRKEVEDHLTSAQRAAVLQRVRAWKPVITPTVAPAKPKTVRRPAEAAAPAPPATGLHAEGGACAAYAPGSPDRITCEDRQKKIQRMKDAQAERDKVYRPPSSSQPGQAGDGQAAVSDKESKAPE